MPQAHATTQPQRRRFERHLAADRRHALIEAALRSLARDGQEGLSIRRIAAEAGVSVGLINHHFPGRMALIAEAYRLLHARLAGPLALAIAAAPPDPSARLSAYLRASFSAPSLDADVLHIWIVFWGLSRTSPEIRAVREETYAASLRVVEGLIREFKGAAPGRPADVSERSEARDMPPRLLAIGLIALLDGLWLEWCLNPATFRAEEGIALAERWIEGMMG
jgi:AcrR family transcriptional regulator